MVNSNFNPNRPSLPPILEAPRVFGRPDSAKLPPWRTALALLLLTCYVLVPALLGAQREDGDDALLPATSRAVLGLCAVELSLFGFVFMVAVALGRPGIDGLRLRWRGGWMIWPRALAWSVGLRVLVGLVLAGAIVLVQWIRGEPVSQLEGLRPKIEAIVDPHALSDPVYLILMLTVVSFVLAGLREEIWRAAMIAFLGSLFPTRFGGRYGPWLALLPVAILFGLGHTQQGWVGVVATTVLGLGLGVLMLRNDSLWDAVLAHGFFNATTFALLPWLSRLFPEIAL